MAVSAKRNAPPSTEHTAAHSHFFQFSKKKRFHEIGGTPSYLCLNIIDQSHNFLELYPTESYWRLFLKQMHQIAGNILQRIPSSFRFSNIRFQNIDSTPPYFYLKKLIKTTDFCHFQATDLCQQLCSVMMMHLLLMVVKVCSKRCQIYKKMLREIVALNHVTFGKLNHNPCFLCFQGCGFFLLDILTTLHVPRFGKNSKAHAKLRTLKQFLELSWYYGMLYWTSIDTK